MTVTNKVVRLNGGRFITRKVIESSPEDLARAKPQEIWLANGDKSRSGKTQYTRPILIRDMELSHLINAMNVIYRREYEKLRRTGTPGFSIEDPDKNRNTHTRNMVTKLCVDTIPQYKAMRDELAVRMGRKKRRQEDKKERAFEL